MDGRMDGWMDGCTDKLLGQMSQQVLSFVSLLSSGTRGTSWWAEPWMLLLWDRFKAGCCCPLGSCLASDSSLLGVILNQPGRRLLLIINCQRRLTAANKKTQVQSFLNRAEIQQKCHINKNKTACRQSITLTFAFHNHKRWNV